MRNKESNGEKGKRLATHLADLGDQEEITGVNAGVSAERQDLGVEILRRKKKEEEEERMRFQKEKKKGETLAMKRRVGGARVWVPF